MAIDLPALEIELKKRTAEPYAPWRRKQNDRWDQATNFIYATPTWSQLKQQTKSFSQALRDYALNRWFNYWSAVGVETIFCQMAGVVAAQNPMDRLVDFAIQGIRFDHKTSVYPRGFRQSLGLAQRYPKCLVEWLYRHQSSQGRQHYGNRLFIVLYDSGPEASHWKLRAELNLMQKAIRRYVAAFDPGKLIRLELNGYGIVSDVIWIIEEGQ